ncbi:hypothetical protein [Bradyrhizobium cosmicum]|uniref:hypothetical protein n=1 Tax=Bradyrhizobium cosmicum TaxID=1404864 RepID=UPI0028EC0B6C|nr:hypothetical protein [Bradyrhizobium cosmicum]
MTRAAVNATATMLKLRAFERGATGRTLARINSVGISRSILFAGDGNNFIQTPRVVRLRQQMAIALQCAFRVDLALGAESGADAGDDVAELAGQKR